MIKVLLLLDCDGCRRHFHLSHFASDDTTAWTVHGDSLVNMAKLDGWSKSEDGNFHYCPTCQAELDDMFSICST